MTKMTYVDALNAVLNGEPVTDAVTEKLTALRDSVAKRNSHKSGKPTKAQVANAELALNSVDLFQGVACGSHELVIIECDWRCFKFCVVQSERVFLDVI